MKKIMIILSFIGIIHAYSSNAQRTAVHWYLPKMSIEEAAQMKGYDLVIVDPENIFNNRASLDKLRADNPEIMIYCYFNIVEWFNPMFSDKPWSKKMISFLDKKEQWFLHGQDGKRLSFWPGTQAMDCSAACPKIPVYSIKDSLTYGQFAMGRFIKDILGQYQFDGVLMDNLWPKIHWLGDYGDNKHGIDYGNLEVNDSVMLDAYWQFGMINCLDILKKYGSEKFTIIGNPGNLDYPRQCSGKMFENFPDIYQNEADKVFEAWYENISNASGFNGPSIFNARRDNYFFTICSAMLLDNIYFSYIQNTGYDSRYQLNLGAPTSSAQSADGVYNRNYQNGAVFVDPQAKKAWIIYNDGTERRE